MKRFIASGVDINQLTEDNIWSTQLASLLVVAIDGKLEAVKFLYDIEADVELTSERGETALFFAALRGHFGIVKYLVEERNANVESASWIEITPTEVTKVEEQDQVLSHLLRRGAAPPKFELANYEEGESLRSRQYEEATMTLAERISYAYWEHEYVL